MCFYVSFYILIYNILLYTYGIHLISGGKKEKTDFKKLMNPGVAACLVSVVVFAGNIPAAESVKSFTGYMGNAAIPMSMMLIGASIAQANLKELLGEAKIYAFLAIKLLIIPMTQRWSSGILRCLRSWREFRVHAWNAGGSIVVPLAAEYGADETCCTRERC